ncbi:MAG TPA: GspH/FimT family protein [Gemmatimonadaceae bacterium]|nr:GspH/FimT family protein [Gemmatimonadaceae bacterium]
MNEMNAHASLGNSGNDRGIRPVARAYYAPSRRSGVTLVELLIVVVVIGIILAMAAPPFAALRERLRIDGAAQQLVGDLRRLQVEAIKRNQSVRLERTGAATYNMDFVGNRTLDGGVTFADASAYEVRMASFGPPVGGGATFILRSGPRQKTVTVSAAGLVTVQ